MMLPNRVGWRVNISPPTPPTGPQQAVPKRPPYLTSVRSVWPSFKSGAVVLEFQ